MKAAFTYFKINGLKTKAAETLLAKRDVTRDVGCALKTTVRICVSVCECAESVQILNVTVLVRVCQYAESVQNNVTIL